MLKNVPKQALHVRYAIHLEFHPLGWSFIHEPPLSSKNIRPHVPTTDLMNWRAPKSTPLPILFSENAQHTLLCCFQIYINSTWGFDVESATVIKFFAK
ncbi:MAG TPA: hypothetical protein VMX97_02510 [Hyphomicrobiaceae bacterium]|nr:hypothetical protein [Hyphomicrobiaceae bacterium]